MRGLLQEDTADNGIYDIRHTHIVKLHQAGIPVPSDNHMIADQIQDSGFNHLTI